MIFAEVHTIFRQKNFLTNSISREMKIARVREKSASPKEDFQTSLQHKETREQVDKLWKVLLITKRSIKIKKACQNFGNQGEPIKVSSPSAFPGAERHLPLINESNLLQMTIALWNSGVNSWMNFVRWNERNSSRKTNKKFTVTTFNNSWIQSLNFKRIQTNQKRAQGI